MIFQVFNVGAGSSALLTSPTHLRELVDLGGNVNWSPVTFALSFGSLDSIFLTHHHGDHLRDLPNLPSTEPGLVSRRQLAGQYAEALRRSNSEEGQALASEFSARYDAWTPASSERTSTQRWGLTRQTYYLSESQAAEVSTSDNSMANNCSWVRLYQSPFGKILVPGDMEKEGMALLLRTHSSFATDVADTDVLVAPHHGHKSGFSVDLFRAMGRPSVALGSTPKGDGHVDSRYSSDEFVRGVSDGVRTLRLLTTRQYGHMTVEFTGPRVFKLDTELT